MGSLGIPFSRRLIPAFRFGLTEIKAESGFKTSFHGRCIMYGSNKIVLCVINRKTDLIHIAVLVRITNSCLRIILFVLQAILELCYIICSILHSGERHCHFSVLNLDCGGSFYKCIWFSHRHLIYLASPVIIKAKGNLVDPICQ